ncbi:Thiol-disulfide oxidoreductase ResA [Chryseobacterium aquaeductus]|uniref:Thiol-disulfide oxidoreductase ResA n=1 Tax=Chryseobacterium aquaeductus TaxID=2675056 RepID=A0A9N8MHD5_9FLAO|nr:redoxin domain-containing protein [Chryseobacterium aquaeductus]CAA7331233.1 Thiol-disulfide oxidoreductase ResA [Chryseobacterium potabilaquae]CAD7808976.1 Thiol-disulfide oxidoreductase ResA [Chryseobacterium aquaeductus]
MFAKIIYTFFFLVAISLNGQSKTGIQFQTKNLEEAKKLAQQENKLIFIDLYTTWCGPCKLMKKNTFPNPELGEFFNKNFISLYSDAEKEGTELAKKFKIVNYPSFLFLDQNGELVQYEYGYYNATQFLNVGQSVLKKKSTNKETPKLDEVKGKMVGEMIPDFTAKDQFKKNFSLSAEKKKTVLVFIRGQWCPYCNKYIESLQNLAPELESKNTRLVIISPEKPEFIEKTISKTKTQYSVLYDENYRIAELFDVLYTPEKKTIDFYEKHLGDDFKKSRSDDSGRLPVSATYILDENQEIIWRHFNPDYKERASLEDILKQL